MSGFEGRPRRGEMSSEELKAIRAFAHMAEGPMEDAGVTLFALASVLAELRPTLSRNQTGVLLAAGGLVASLAKREIEAADQVAALLSKLKGE